MHQFAAALANATLEMQQAQTGPQEQCEVFKTDLSAGIAPVLLSTPYIPPTLTLAYTSSLRTQTVLQAFIH